MAHNKNSYGSRKYQTGGLFDLILRALDKSIDPILRVAFQKEMFKEQLYDAQFRAQIVEEVTERVLARLSLDLDISQALQQIKELEDAISRLGK